MSDENLSIPEYLSLLHTYFVEIKKEGQQGLEITQNQVQIYQSIPLWVDRAVVEIKANKQTIDRMEQDMRELIHQNKMLLESKADCQILERKVVEKTQEIEILKDTVRGLYAETEGFLQEKKALSREVAALKESNSGLKKKLKKTEEEANSYRQDIKKITDINEEKMDSIISSEQAREEQLKHFSHQLERVKSELLRKEKQLGQTTRRAEELKQSSVASEELIEKLKTQKKNVSVQYENFKQKSSIDKKKLIQEQQLLLKELQSNTDLLQKDRRTIHQLNQKCLRYQKEIIQRTDKLKQKSKHIKILSEETSKINKKVEDLSRVAEQLMAENQSMRQDNDALGHQNAQYKGFYHQLGRMKSDISSKKESEVMKLAECLEKLTSYNNVNLMT